METNFEQKFMQILEETIEKADVAIDSIISNITLRKCIFRHCLDNPLIINASIEERGMFWRYFERNLGSLQEE